MDKKNKSDKNIWGLLKGWNKNANELKNESRKGWR